jgi:proliferating cell nuclear antigen PCNA
MNKFSKQDLSTCDLSIVIQNSLKAELFTILFQHMKVFSEHINILFEKDRMFIQSMDSSRISIFEISLPKEWFDTYELSKGIQPENDSVKPVTLGIHSSILFRVLSARDKTQEIHFNFNSNENQDVLNIHFTGNNKTEFDKHFEISLLDVDLELMSIPESEPQAEFSISSFHFANIVNQLKMFGDNLDVHCCEEKIMLCSNSIEQGKMFVEIKIDDLSSFIIDEGGNIKMSFSLNSLHNICLYNKLSREVVISFKDSYPMKIVYSLFGHEHAKMTFYLAPKIGDDD